MDIRTLCLGVLSRGETTGYGIKKHFEQAFRHFFPAGFASVYPALAALERDGLATASDVPQDGRPDKRVYAITERGRASLHEALMAAPARHRVRSEFLACLYFADQLPRARLAALLDERERDIEALLAHIDRLLDSDDCPATDRAVAECGRSTLQAQLDHLVGHREALLALAADHGREEVRRA
ncbi:MAG: PadR family transcriptional regulator [Planctomycetes bacterium]|nr:PadR family transcriptional regulator [Planctomycetota bacterium]